MSADNAICVQKRDDLWWVWMGFASDDINEPDETDRSFYFEVDAMRFAAEWAEKELFLEYGIWVLEPLVSPPQSPNTVDL